MADSEADEARYGQLDASTPKLTMGSLIHTVQGCDGYQMDLIECAEHYGVTTDALKAFAATGPSWLIVGKYDGTDEEYIACDGD